jgi:heterodisulfide reductase subunit A-like polyferredoxin
MPNTTRRIVMTVPPKEVERPIVYRLVKDFEIVPSILKASINPNDVGMMVLEIVGTAENISRAIEFMRGLGVKIEELGQEIVWNEDKCIHCGACVTFCRFGALRYKDASLRVEFDSDKCTACELCLRACPTRAMEGCF